MKYQLIALIFVLFTFQSVSLAQDEPLLILNPHGHSARMFDALVTPDQKTLITVSEDRSICFWNTHTAELKYIYRGYLDNQQNGIINAGCLSPDGQYLVYGGFMFDYGNSSFFTSILSLKTMEIVATLRGQQQNVHALAWSSDGKCIAAGCGDKKIYLWEIPELPHDQFKTINSFATLEGHENFMQALAFSPDNKLLVSGGLDGLLILWDLPDNIRDLQQGGPSKQVIKQHENYVNFVAFLPDGKRFVSAGQDKKLYLWKSSGKLIKEIDTWDEVPGKSSNSGAIFSISISPDGKKLLAHGYNGADAVVYSLPDGKRICTFDKNNNSVLATAFLNNEIAISTGGNSADIFFWDSESGEEISHASSKGQYILSLGMGKGMTLAFGGEKLAPIEIEVDLHRFNQTADYPQFFPLTHTFDFENFMLAKAEGEGVYRRVMLQNGQKTIQKKDETSINIGEHKITAQEDGERTVAYTFIPGGDVILATDFSLKRYTPEGKLRCSYIGHLSMVTAVTVSKDGKYLFSCSADQTIKVWSLDDMGRFPSCNDVMNQSWKDFFESEGIDSLARIPSEEAWTQIIKYLEDKGDSDSEVLEGIKTKVRREVMPLVTLFVGLDEEWVCWTPNGYFTASSQGDQYMGWHVNHGVHRRGEFFAARQLFDKYYRPDVVREVLNSRQQDTIVAKRFDDKVLDIGNNLQGVPDVQIKLPDNEEANQRGVLASGDSLISLRDEITLTIETTDRGGGIDQIMLYHNGKLIESTNRGVNALVRPNRKQQQRYQVRLVAGHNSFRATAFNNNRTEATPDEIIVYYKADNKAISNLHILAIGLNSYKNSSYNLNYAVPDTRAFVKELSVGSKDLFGEVKSHLLLDSMATKANIVNKLAEIKQMAKPEDAFVLYYAGHGVLSENMANKRDEFYLVPYDVTQLYGDSEQLAEKAISASEMVTLSRDIPARKQLIVLDACQSGGAIDEFANRGFAEEKAVMQLARSAGVFLLAASGSDQYASEFESLGHGVFTYSLIEGMKGQADGFKDNKVTVFELGAYLRYRVPELSEKHRGQVQYPKVFSRGDDFPIIIMKP